MPPNKRRAGTIKRKEKTRPRRLESSTPDLSFLLEQNMKLPVWQTTISDMIWVIHSLQPRTCIHQTVLTEHLPVPRTKGSQFLPDTTLDMFSFQSGVLMSLSVKEQLFCGHKWIFLLLRAYKELNFPLRWTIILIASELYLQTCI